MEKRIDYKKKKSVPGAKLNSHQSCLNDTFVLKDLRQERTGPSLCNVFKFHQQDFLKLFSPRFKLRDPSSVHREGIRVRRCYWALNEFLFSLPVTPWGTLMHRKPTSRDLGPVRLQACAADRGLSSAEVGSTLPPAHKNVRSGEWRLTQEALTRSRVADTAAFPSCSLRQWDFSRKKVDFKWVTATCPRL